MALLQIAEPGRAAAPHQHRLAVGIDLGTTNSLVAAVRSGLPTVLPDERGRRLLPSVVHYAADGRRIVGEAARAHAADDPLNTIASAKRLIGPLAGGRRRPALRLRAGGAVGQCGSGVRTRQGLPVAGGGRCRGAAGVEGAGRGLARRASWSAR